MSSITTNEAGIPVATRPRRSAQLGMLIFAMIVTVAGFAQVGLARDGNLPAGMYGYGLGLGVLAAGAYFVVARFAPYADPLLLPLAVLLNGIGLVLFFWLVFFFCLVLLVVFVVGLLVFFFCFLF